MTQKNKIKKMKININKSVSIIFVSNGFFFRESTENYANNIKIVIITTVSKKREAKEENKIWSISFHLYLFSVTLELKYGNLKKK